MTRTLPIATNFCGATLELFDGLSLFLDGNSKITRGNGTYLEPKPNAFSLPAASVPTPYPGAGPRACPGSTPICRASCYVKGLAQHAPELYAHYQSNADTLAEIFACSKGRLFPWSALKLAMWIEDNAREGFRWHVSGDVLNEQHAQWIVTVCGLAPEVPFWIYTRTLGVVGALREARNLAVNVSADADNFADARAIAIEHGARICYLTTGEHDWKPFHENAPRHCDRCDSYDTSDLVRPCSGVPADLPAGSVIFPDYPLRKRVGSDWFDTLTPKHKRMTCPTDVFSQSEAHRCGPCSKCF